MLQFMIESIRELIICSDHVLDVFLFGKFINQRTSGRFGRESYAAERNSPCLNELEKLWGSSITCLGFFVHYRFSERFQKKTEPLNRQVQFMISMHSECFNLSQSFVLPCSVLCCSVLWCSFCPVIWSPQSFVCCHHHHRMLVFASGVPIVAHGRPCAVKQQRSLLYRDVSPVYRKSRIDFN